MAFPESPRVVFGRNPLKEVVCQLSFPTILRIASESPGTFQEAIRERYPRYERQSPAMPPEFSQALERFGLANGGQNLTHRFLSADSSSGVALTSESVAVWTHRYSRWESFRNEVARAQQALEQVYTPSLYDRIGLRYIDLIDKRDLELAEVPWNELVRTSLVGVLGERTLAPNVRHCHGQLTLSLDEPIGSLVRISHGLHEDTDISQEDTDISQSRYFIDADFYTTTTTEDNHVIDTIDQFNRLAGNFFRWTITERLRDALAPTGTLD